MIADNTLLEDQVKVLAQFILDNFPYEPKTSGGAIEIAMTILEHHRQAVFDLQQEQYRTKLLQRANASLTDEINHVRVAADAIRRHQEVLHHQLSETSRSFRSYGDEINRLRAQNKAQAERIVELESSFQSGEQGAQGLPTV